MTSNEERVVTIRFLSLYFVDQDYELTGNVSPYVVVKNAFFFSFISFLFLIVYRLEHFNVVIVVLLWSFRYIKTKGKRKN